MNKGQRNSFCQRLRELAEPIWQRELEHPFVRGLLTGALPRESYVFYLRQDYVFLIQYARVLGLACARAPDLESMRSMATLLRGTLEQEMQLHRAYCARFGISAEELARTVAAPVTHAYTSHLLSTAYSGTFAQILASLLPCQWGYAEIGAKLAEEQRGRGRSPYADWIDTYSSPEFRNSAVGMSKRLEAEAQNCSTRELSELEALFLTSSRYELMFWEMALNREDWP